MLVHANLESLYQHIPKSILPMEYGGDGGAIKEITGKLFLLAGRPGAQ